MILQEALAMFPPDGSTMSMLPEDAMQEIRYLREAGQVLADAFRRLKNEHVALLGDMRELHQSAQLGTASDYALVPKALVRKPIVRAIEFYRGIA